MDGFTDTRTSLKTFSLPGEEESQLINGTAKTGSEMASESPP